MAGIMDGDSRLHPEAGNGVSSPTLLSLEFLLSSLPVQSCRFMRAAGEQLLPRIFAKAFLSRRNYTHVDSGVDWLCGP
jgi:hypothetical protein